MEKIFFILKFAYIEGRYFVLFLQNFNNFMVYCPLDVRYLTFSIYVFFRRTMNDGMFIGKRAYFSNRHAHNPVRLLEMDRKKVLDGCCICYPVWKLDILWSSDEFKAVNTKKMAS